MTDKHDTSRSAALWMYTSGGWHDQQSLQRRRRLTTSQAQWVMSYLLDKLDQWAGPGNWETRIGLDRRQRPLRQILIHRLPHLPSGDTKTDQAEAMLRADLTLKPAEIARRLGCSKAVVYQARRRLVIAELLDELPNKSSRPPASPEEQRSFRDQSRLNALWPRRGSA